MPGIFMSVSTMSKRSRSQEVCGFDAAGGQSDVVLVEAQDVVQQQTDR